MKNKKNRKHFLALMLCTALLFSILPVNAADTGRQQDALADADRQGQDVEADANGFVIENGILKKYTGNEARVEVPSGVTEIGDNAFARCEDIESVVIPSGVTSIGEAAFAKCYHLESITIPDTVNHFGVGAFAETKWLENKRDNHELVILNHIVVDAFSCEGDVVVPEGVTALADYAFAVCGGIDSVTIPEGVTSIGSHMFYLSASLKSVQLPSTITSIGEDAFWGCTGLQGISIPEGVTSIGKMAFYSCWSIKRVDIPSGVARIEDSTFTMCDALERITILENVTHIGANAIPGKCTIYGKTGSYAEYYAGEHQIKFVAIGEASGKRIPESGVRMSAESYVYDGTAKTPIVTAEDGEEVLEEGVDYIVRYEDNVEVGTAKVILTGIGRYTGEVVKTFTIKPVDPTPPQPEENDISRCSVAIRPGAYTCDGTEKRPNVTVRDGENLLVENTDYTVRYEDNINIGKARIIITGMGNYRGTVTKCFIIVKAQEKFREKGAQSIACKTSYNKIYGDKAFTLDVERTKGDGKLIYTSLNERVVTVNDQGKVTIRGTGAAIIRVKAKETVDNQEASVKILVWVKPAKQKMASLKALDGKRLKVSWKKDERAAGYEIQYSTDRKFNKKKNIKTKVVKSKLTKSLTIRNLKAGKRYYVRVRAFKQAKIDDTSRKLYGAWSNSKNVKARE